MRARLLSFAIGRAVAALLLVMSCAMAQAGGARWLSGTPYFMVTGVPIAWYTKQPMYFTDAGDLSASVDHAAADALVASAAAVWNVPTASLVLAQGGSLNEHVTGAMLAVGGGMPVLPADMQSTNYLAKQIAVIYDTDGSVLDALLGAGASDPSGCLQTGVVESVDSFGTAGTIQHAVLILNGRCTGAEPEKQLQMKYQLMRAFGRVLGLGWSQTNDNVFTSAPVPSYNQALNWPVMHPIDVMCGPYTYQCMPQPFTLRADDLSAMTQLYPIPQGQSAGQAGKVDSLASASMISGYISFPNGQGMEGVNVTVRRRANFSPVVEDWQTVSSVSGYAWRRQTGTPVAAQDGLPLSSIGLYDPTAEGYWQMDRVPIPDANPWQTLLIRTEPVNPLYTGPYALTTMASGSMTFAPSGSAIQTESNIEGRYYNWDRLHLTVPDAVSDCRAGNDGTEGAPVTMAQTGWWTGVLCGYTHSSWAQLSVKANRSFTLEVTALDETGSASAAKAMPMIGVWRASDALGVAPTVAVTPTVAFNAIGVGMTSLVVQSTAATAMRAVIVDQRGAGRPDFAYQARMLYADSIEPANLGAAGGTVVITGTGFRAGNVVTINGVAALVLAVTPTTITAIAPSLRALGTSKALLARVVVRDVTTNGVTAMTAALGYGSPQERLQLVSAPAGTTVQGQAAATPMAVQVLASDGVTPVANETVSFAVSKGSATFGVCGGASCVVKTNAQGLALTTVTPTTAGTVALLASTSLLSVTASFSVVAQPDTMTLVSAPATAVIATVGALTGVPLSVRVVAGDGVTARAGETVTVTVVSGRARLEACGAASCSLKTDATGTVATAVTPLGSEVITLQAMSAAGSVATSFRAAAETMQVVSAPVGSVVVGTAAPTAFAVRVLAADGVSPLMGETVQFQTTAGAALLGGTGATGCAVMTDANGLASVSVTPMAASAVTITASGTAGTATATLYAIQRPSVMAVVETPTGQAIAGSALNPGFGIQLLLADGKTPVAGQPVTFSVMAGAATLLACGGATCTVVTGANGMARTAATATAAGTLQITAQASGVQGGLVQTVTIAVTARQRAVTAAAPVVYVAEGVATNWTAQVSLSDNLQATDGTAVVWTGAAGMSFASATSAASGSSATTPVQVAGLAAGVRVQGTACAWGGVCGTIAAEGVSAALWQVQVVSGGGQQLSGGGEFAPVVLRVVDGAGHPVVAANVGIYEAVSAWQQACVDRGRCPAAEVLNSAASRLVSDGNGLLTLSASQLAAVQSGADAGPVVMQITIAAGTQGNATVTLARLP